MKVSIITSSYNREQTIGGCIESVLAQDYPDIEYIIVDGAWIGAKTTVCPGVTVHRNAILTAGSVATKDMEENGIYQGNPAVKIRERKIKE